MDNILANEINTKDMKELEEKDPLAAAHARYLAEKSGANLGKPLSERSAVFAALSAAAERDRDSDTHVFEDYSFSDM